VRFGGAAGRTCCQAKPEVPRRDEIAGYGHLMALPTGLAALVADLQRLGFSIESEEWHPWPRGGKVELARLRGTGVKRVRMTEDRGVWDVEVKIGRRWYEPLTALRALDERPHQQRALSHDERLNATLELVNRFTGERAQVNAIKKRQKELTAAYTRWAQGKSDTNPLA
jgi:hypothetical protein